MNAGNFWPSNNVDLALRTLCDDEKKRTQFIFLKAGRFIAVVCMFICNIRITDRNPSNNKAGVLLKKKYLSY